MSLTNPTPQPNAQAMFDATEGSAGDEGSPRRNRMTLASVALAALVLAEVACVVLLVTDVSGLALAGLLVIDVVCLTVFIAAARQ